MPSKATLSKMKTMFDGSLPITTAKVKTGIIKTLIEKGNYDINHIYETIPVEVLSISFNTGNMRVRYVASIWSEAPSIECVDIDATEFIENLSWKRN